ncbi:APC family permease [Pseudomonas kurunegalensis]|uniref:APC family permease n=1 Tax=Pseudomonas kurunegalensis TaxID=485880 RepID=A0ACC5UHF7_9PSED|nr:APC family permease [Pseudomonas kurunegalensis]MBV4513810.1 APC family permease [Pseudomonas kurunegalensis]
MANNENNPSHLSKTLRWTDAFALSMAVSGSIFASFGFALGALGPIGALVLWVGSAAIGACQNWIFLEVTAMYPDKPGGIAMIATEGWKRRCTLVGPIASFGYWMGWSAVLAIVGVSAGSLIQAQWFADQTWGYQLGSVSIGLAQFIGAGLILVFWQFNRLGVQMAASVSKYMGVLLLIPILVLAFAPLYSDAWSFSHFQTAWDRLPATDWTTGRTALMWLFLIAWSAYGTEMCAAFGPEYRSKRDMRMALITSGLYTVAAFAAVAFSLGGLADQQAAIDNPNGFFIGAFDAILGNEYSSFFVGTLLVGLFMGLNASLADGSRALYGMALDGLTIRQLGILNKHQVPGRCMTVAVILNVGMIFLLSSPLAILVTANIGYVASIFFALSGFLWLRKDAAHLERPVKLGQGWIPVAWALSLLTGLIVLVGAASTELVGYGGTKELLMGIGILLLSVVLYGVRKLQDRQQPNGPTSHNSF